MPRYGSNSNLISFTNKRLPKSLVSRIRADKKLGMSLLDIHDKYGIAKSTASLYTRDLYRHPLRKYTEEEYRRIIYLRGVNKNHEAWHNCIDCGKLIRKRANRCMGCSLIYEKSRIEFYKKCGAKTGFYIGNKGNRYTISKGKRVYILNDWQLDTIYKLTSNIIADYRNDIIQDVAIECLKMGTNNITETNLISLIRIVSKQYKNKDISNKYKTISLYKKNPITNDELWTNIKSNEDDFTKEIDERLSL